MARTIARAAAMQMIFENLSGGEGGEETLQMVYDALREEHANDEIPVNKGEPTKSDRSFIESELVGVLNHLDELDEVISKASNGWNLDRMPKVDLTILRLAVYEMLYVDDIPGSVTINEAIELSRRYSDPEKSGRFINGVLGTILRQQEENA